MADETGIDAEIDAGRDAPPRRLRLHDEQQEADVERRDAMDVRLARAATEETQALEVGVQRERVRIRSRLVGSVVEDPSDAFKAATFVVPIHEERVTLRKETHLVEEIEVSRVILEDIERIDAPARRETFGFDEPRGGLDGRHG